MSHDLPAPDLGISPQEAGAQFDQLQAKLVPLWKSIESFNQDEQTIVIVPSMNIDSEFTSTELQAYEERFLFLLLLLRQPRAPVRRPGICQRRAPARCQRKHGHVPTPGRNRRSHGRTSTW